MRDRCVNIKNNQNKYNSRLWPWRWFNKMFIRNYWTRYQWMRDQSTILRQYPWRQTMKLIPIIMDFGRPHHHFKMRNSSSGHFLIFQPGNQSICNSVTYPIVSRWDSEEVKSCFFFTYTNTNTENHIGSVQKSMNITIFF